MQLYVPVYFVSTYLVSQMHANALIDYELLSHPLPPCTLHQISDTLSSHNCVLQKAMYLLSEYAIMLLIVRYYCYLIILSLEYLYNLQVYSIMWSQDISIMIIPSSFSGNAYFIMLNKQILYSN